MKVKRYMVFAGEGYYPQRPFRIFVASFDEREKAVRVATSRLRDSDWTVILDLEESTYTEFGRYTSNGEKWHPIAPHHSWVEPGADS